MISQLEGDKLKSFICLHQTNSHKKIIYIKQEKGGVSHWIRITFLIWFTMKLHCFKNIETTSWGD